MPRARPRCAACGRFVSGTVTLCRRCEAAKQRTPLAVAMMLGLDEPALPVPRAPVSAQARPTAPALTRSSIDTLLIAPVDRDASANGTPAITPIPIGEDVVRARARSDFIVPRPSELHPDLHPSTPSPQPTRADRNGDVAPRRRSLPAALIRSLVSGILSMLEGLPHPRVAAAVVIVAVVVGVAVVVLGRG